MFNAAKDALASQAARSFVNAQIKRYGEVQTLKIDSKAKTISATCQLHGEAGPIAVEVKNYVIEEEGGKRFVRITAATCSRLWLQNLLEDLGRDRRFELPSWAAAAL